MKVTNDGIVIDAESFMQVESVRKLAVEMLVTDPNTMNAMIDRLTHERDEIEGYDWWGFSTGEVKSLLDAGRERLLAVADASAARLAENAVKDRTKHYERAEALQREVWTLQKRVRELEWEARDAAP
jgi:hypothetical protein